MSALGEAVRGRFVALMRASPKVKKLLADIADDASMAKVEELSGITGTLLKRALGELVTSANFPVGDVAEILSIIAPALETNHGVIARVAAQVQKSINASQGNSMRAVVPRYDRRTAMNIAGRMANYETYEEAEWMLDEPIETASVNESDEAFRANAERQRRFGKKLIVVRTADSGACPWCESLAGTYDYDEVRDKSSPVWQRHNNCFCEIEVVEDPNQPDSYDDFYREDEERSERIAEAKQREREEEAGETAARYKRIQRSKQH